MGQRLIMTIKDNDVDLMKVYYHWSAYTVQSYLEALNFVNAYEDERFKNISDKKLRCIRALESLAARLDNESEFNEFKRLYPNEELIDTNLDRTNGLIALTEKDMKDVQDWSEGNLTIYLDHKRIFSSCYQEFENINDYNNYYSDEEELELDDLPIIDCDLDNITFDNIDEVYNCMEDYVYENSKYTLRTLDNTIISVIA